MRRGIKNTVYALAVSGGISSVALAVGGAQIAGTVTLPGYGGKQGPIELSLADLIDKCEEFERHEQVAKFTADITCKVAQDMWANGRYNQYQTDYEPFFAEFDLNVKGKFNSNWIPLTDGRVSFTEECGSVEKWRITAMRTVKVHSCEELRSMQANPKYCEDAFAASSCVTADRIQAKIQVARSSKLAAYDDQECHGERVLEIDPGTPESLVPVEAEQIPSGYHAPVTYSEVECSDLGMSSPVHLALKTIDLQKGDQIVQAVQVIAQGEVQDKTLAPNLGQMTLITGMFPRANDILWRINGRRVERAEEACQMLGEIKTLAGSSTKMNPIKMSFYSAGDVDYMSSVVTVGTSERKHLVAKY